MTDTIAIDFGTSRTKVAYWDERTEKPQLVHLGYRNEPFVPSLFYLPAGSERILWGNEAEELLEDDPGGVVDVLKRRLQDRYVYANRRKITPQELLVHLLRGLRERVSAEVIAFTGQLPTKALLTVPALCGPATEKLMREAAQAASFKVVELVSEPVAAARTWLAETGEAGREVVVLDCGGGTLDWAYASYKEGQFKLVADCPPGSDPRVGGHDVDQELLNELHERVEDAEAMDRRLPYYLEQVRVLKERYCRGLPLRRLRVGGKEVTLEEQTFQAVLDSRFVQQAAESLKSYLARIEQIRPDAKPTVLLVGGSARIKGLKETLEAQCGRQVVWWEHSEYATVLGAAFTAPPVPPQPVEVNLIHPQQVKAHSTPPKPGPIPPKPMYEPYHVFRDRLKDGTAAPEMVYLPGGTFRMGDIQGNGHSNERPVHKVTLDAFAMGRYPVTVGEFQRFVDATGYQTDAERQDGAWVWDSKEWATHSDANWHNPYFPQQDTHPVVCISWNDAVAYCEWLSGQTGERYSLPTEAQWEYACRAGHETAYCFGNEEEQLSQYAWYLANAENKLHPVGQKKGNAWNLYDLHGNVYEWVQDWYGDYSKEPQRNPNGPTEGSDRVIRDGSWGSTAVYCRSACRNGGAAGGCGGILGFRLARRV